MTAGRKLQLKARAARMADTRQRIVRAAYDLHCTVGPAQATVSAIAEQAGVQRHTVYQHFPNELALSGACTQYGLSLDPQPDPAPLAAITDPNERLRTALTQQYAYYRRNESLLANVQRDAPWLQQRLQAAGLDESALPESLRGFLAQPARVRAALAAGWGVGGAKRVRLVAALGLALAFNSWRTLVGEHGLADSEAVEVMIQLIRCVVRPTPGI